MLLEGLMGAITLQTDKPIYQVGEDMLFKIEGGFPNSLIAWTSFKDGVSTGEYQSAYPNQFLDAAGNLTLPLGAPWQASHVGLWEKQVISINPEKSDDIKTAKVIFSVVPAGQGVATDQNQSQSPGFFEQSIDLFGTPVPVVALIAAGGLALFAFARR